MRSNRSGTSHLHSEFSTEIAGLRVEVVDHFHVIGHESDRHNNNRFRPRGTNSAQMVKDVGFEPRLSWRSATALKYEWIPAATKFVPIPVVTPP